MSRATDFTETEAIICVVANMMEADRSYWVVGGGPSRLATLLAQALYIPNLTASTTPQILAISIRGLTAMEMLYPSTARILRLPILSLSHPLNIRKMASALSESPPTNPTTVVAAPSTLVRKRGTSVKIISLETSVSRLTTPRKKTLALSPKILPRSG